MRVKRWHKRLSEFLEMVDTKQVRINKRYQRSGKVWPPNAKSYLVETVIRGFVFPRLMIHAIAGRPGLRGHAEIIDGQQRTATLLSFRKNEFSLSAAVDRKSLKGKRYSTLRPADRHAFDNYVLKMDRFEGATEGNIREFFRRINYYTAPLNPEEQRHARFQGEFKWFIQRRREEFDPVFTKAGVLTENQMERMGGAKLLTEVVHAMVYGISTTKAGNLKKIYSDFDREFELEHDFKQRLAAARPVFASWGRLPTPMAGPHQAYGLLLALLHIQRRLEPLGTLVDRGPSLKEADTVLRNLKDLASVLKQDEDDVPNKYTAFYKASQKGTNVRSRRESRFRWCYRALTEDHL